MRPRPKYNVGQLVELSMPTGPEYGRVARVIKLGPYETAWNDHEGWIYNIRFLDNQEEATYFETGLRRYVEPFEVAQ